MSKILIIKTDALSTLQLVLSSSLYYSENKPLEQFDEVWVMSNATNGQVTINARYGGCAIVPMPPARLNSAFVQVAKGHSWKWAWELMNRLPGGELVIPTNTGLFSFVSNICYIQTFGYIDLDTNQEEIISAYLTLYDACLQNESTLIIK